MAAWLPAACVRQLPPAPTPAAVLPPLVVAPPPSGEGQLVVDVVDGPTPVHRIRMDSKPVDNGRGRQSYRFFESPEILCAVSPCATNLPAGNVVLGFPVRGKPDALEIELVHLGPDPSVYRRSLSVYENRTGAVRVLGIVSASVGAGATITGLTLLPIGLAKDNDPLATAGGIALGAGAVLLAIGIWAIRHDAPTYRPGSSNHFPLAVHSE